MSQIKGLLKSSTIYIVLGFLPMGINFLLLPVLSQELSEAEYGLLALANLFVGLITIFIGLGLDSAFSRYYYQYYKKPNLVETLLSTIILSVIAIGISLAIILFFVGDELFSAALNNQVFTYSDYGIYVFITTVNTVILNLFLAYFRNEERPLAFGISSMSAFILALSGILVGVLYYEAGALGSIIGRMIGSFPVTLVLLVLFYGKAKNLRFDFRFIKVLLNYSLPLIPYLFLLYLYNNIDKFMVERSFESESLDFLGKYNLAFQISTAIQVLLYAIFNSISPQIYKALESRSSDSINFSIKLLKVFHIFILGVIVCFIAGSDLIYKVFIDQKFHEGINYIGILCLIYIPQLYYVLYTISLFYKKITKPLPIISLVALIVGVSANLILIPPFGIYGVCIATLLTKMAQFAVTFFYLKKYQLLDYGFNQMKKEHMLSLLILIGYLVALSGYYWLDLNNWISINLVNLIPLVLFILIIVTVFRKELKTIPILLAKIKG